MAVDQEKLEKHLDREGKTVTVSGKAYQKFLLFLPEEGRSLIMGVDDGEVLASINTQVGIVIRKLLEHKNIAPLAVLTKMLQELAEECASATMDSLPDDLRTELEVSAHKAIKKEAGDGKVS
jgi:hypothetical protein